MAAPQNHHELAGNGFGRVHRVAQSPLGDLWLALDQRRGPPGDPVLLRYVTLSASANWDTLERVAAAGRAAMSLRSELLLPVVDVLREGPLAIAYEYVEALPLSTLQSCARTRERLFPVGVALRLTIDLLRALQVVHESWPGWPTEPPFGGLFPASVLVARDGRTRLCDALVAPSALLQRGFDLSAADLAYRAPEQVYASTAPEPSTDVFIASVLLWELLAGRRMLSGSKEFIERKLLEHSLPRANAELRPDCQLSRGLVELVNSGLSLDTGQRPATPGALATALEHCRHDIASHAEVAAFVSEIAGEQLDDSVTILRMALGYAGGAQDAQLDSDTDVDNAVPADGSERAALLEKQREFAAQWQELAARQSEVPAARSDVAPRPREGDPTPSAAAPPGARSGSRAGALRRALARRRGTSGEAARSAPQHPLPRSAALPAETAAGTDARPDAPVPVPPKSGPAFPIPLPMPPLELANDAEEKTAVYAAVRLDDGVRGSSPPQPVRLAPKRALLAALAGVVLLIQLWMFVLARSQPRNPEPDTPSPDFPGGELRDGR